MRLLKWLYPGIQLKRWLLLFLLGIFLASGGLALIFNYKYVGVLEEQIFRFMYWATGGYYYTASSIAGVLIVIVGLGIMVHAIRKVIRSVIGVLEPESAEKFLDLVFEQRKLNRGPSIAVIGGGTGLSVLLRGIKEVTSNATAIVTVADDGGSSGRLREELGILPPGDLRNCLVALADTEPLMEKLFQHRFTGNSVLAGHNFGNLFIAAMTEVVGGDVEQALKESQKVLKVRGQVIASTSAAVCLNARMTDGTIVQGESLIPKAKKQIEKIFLSPEDACPSQSALEAIRDADAVILGPGSLYTSILPNLILPGMADALRHSRAVKIYICNVMTQPGETDGYTASQHVQAIIDHVGVGCIDYVLVNNQEVAPALRAVYASQGQTPVEADVDVLAEMGLKVRKAGIISETNLVRHDPVKLSRVILSMVYRLKSHSERMQLLDYYLIRRKRNRE